MSGSESRSLRPSGAKASDVRRCNSRVALHHEAVVIVRAEHGERRMVGGEPVTVMLQHSLGGPEDADAPILVRAQHLHEADGAQARDEVIDLALACAQAERCQVLLQPPDREPGLALGGIVARLQDDGEMEDQEPPGLDQQPDQERIVAVHGEKAVEIELARLGEARMSQDLVLGYMRRPRQQLLDGRIVHCSTGANPRRRDESGQYFPVAAC